MQELHLHCLHIQRALYLPVKLMEPFQQNPVKEQVWVKEPNHLPRETLHVVNRNYIPKILSLDSNIQIREYQCTRLLRVDQNHHSSNLGDATGPLHDLNKT